MSAKRIGVYVCQCGGNISDYVDTEQVAADSRLDTHVVVARTAMFTCSDATQQEIIKDIQEQQLDGLVVASCSPKLHTFTFREVARRADLNPYQYTQVNIREQCSWAHTDDRDGATCKATCLVRAGIARTALSTPLEPSVVRTVSKVLVIGGGIAGLRAALGLAEIGIAVVLVEKEPHLGGWVGGFGDMYPHGRNGRALIAHLTEAIRHHPEITVFTNAEVVSKAGTLGNYQAGIRVGADAAETMQVQVGAIIVATGFDTYQPEAGEFGYGIEGVITLPEFKQLLDGATGPLAYHGRPIKRIAYVYCVGSRKQPDQTGRHFDCSRYCCAATVHASISVAALGHKVSQYHLYRDMRTYGKYETMYSDSREKGSLYLKFADDAPPVVELDGESGGLRVTLRDLLTGGEELTIPVDLVVLVTGMTPRPTEALVKALKVPVGRDGFFNEIHPKLRPVETVVDGVYLCGACQGPKNSSESVASGLAAITQSASVLKKGYAELDPLVAMVDPERCTWCGKCQDACVYGSVEQQWLNGKMAAVIIDAGCKGCGACVPVCPENAIDLQGYTDGQVTSMIDALLREVVR